MRRPFGASFSGEFMNIAICMPCTDDVPVGTMMCLLALQNYLVTHPVDEDQGLNIFIEQSSLLVQSRQNLIQRALDWKADWILMLDSDMTFPANTFHRLAKHNKGIVACNYVRRSIPTAPVTKGKDDKFIITNDDSEGIEIAKFTGFGVCLVAADVFKQLDKPWFDTIWMEHKDEGRVECLGEDVFFFEKVRYFTDQELWIDHDLSKEVTHIGQFEYHNILAETVKEELDDEDLKVRLYRG